MKESFKIFQHQTTTDDPHNGVNEDDHSVSKSDLIDNLHPNSLKLDVMCSLPGILCTKFLPLKIGLFNGVL